MADDKKKEKPEGWNLDPIEWLIVVVIFLFLLSNIVPAIGRYLSGGVSFYGFELSGAGGFFTSNLWILKIFGFVLTGIAGIGAIVFSRKGDAIWREEKAKVYPEGMLEESGEVEGPMQNPVRERWDKIVALSESMNQSDWRLCIIEADIMLDDLLLQLQLPGDTMGEKLKAVEKSDFTTIDLAWEAHKLRNMIAHEGNNFLLNQRETRRIISLYEAVFKEFSLI